MPQFYFHVIGRTMEVDELGTDLRSAADARSEGVKLVGNLLTEGTLERHGGAFVMEIMDEAGLVLFRLEVRSWSAPGLGAA